MPYTLCAVVRAHVRTVSIPHRHRAAKGAMVTTRIRQLAPNTHMFDGGSRDIPVNTHKRLRSADASLAGKDKVVTDE
jgi:hypothetical protein